MGVTKCQVPGCESTNRCEDISFHEFPSNNSVRSEWLRNIKRDDWIPTTSSRICSLHFDAECFKTASGLCKKRWLKRDAVPTVFPSYPERVQKEIRRISKTMQTAGPLPKKRKQEMNQGISETASNRIKHEAENIISSSFSRNPNEMQVPPLAIEDHSNLRHESGDHSNSLLEVDHCSGLQVKVEHNSELPEADDHCNLPLQVDDFSNVTIKVECSEPLEADDDCNSLFEAEDYSSLLIKAEFSGEPLEADDYSNLPIKAEFSGEPALEADPCSSPPEAAGDSSRTVDQSSAPRKAAARRRSSPRTLNNLIGSVWGRLFCPHKASRALELANEKLSHLRRRVDELEQENEALQKEWAKTKIFKQVHLAAENGDEHAMILREQVRVFGNEQVQWSPTLLRKCIILQQMFPDAYKYLYSTSRLLRLPCPRTIDGYILSTGMTLPSRSARKRDADIFAELKTITSSMFDDGSILP